MERVVITGMGAVTPIGNDVEALFTAIKEGNCGIAPITHFDTTDYKVKLAAEVKDLDMEQYFNKRDLKFNDRFTQFARIAAKQAMEMAGLTKDEADSERYGCLVASGIGGISTIETSEKTMEERGPSRVSPYFIPMALSNLAAGQIAIDWGLRGTCECVVTACAAGANAIGEAFRKIRDGYEDVMVTGGAEASITPLSIAGFQSMRALHTGTDPERASIPFDAERSGFVMGEGAGILVLESLTHAKARNATILGEIVGYGASCDAHHITAPLNDGSGGAKAMVNAITDAGIQKEDIAYINAHGTSTSLNDKAETLAVKAAFGEHAKHLAISSTKSNTGHLLGASGAVEAIICVKALKEGIIPATIHYEKADPDCDLDIVPNKCRKQNYTYAMSNSLGFGGHNASILFKKYEG